MVQRLRHLLLSTNFRVGLENKPADKRNYLGNMFGFLWNTWSLLVAHCSDGAFGLPIEDGFEVASLHGIELQTPPTFPSRLGCELCRSALRNLR